MRGEAFSDGKDARGAESAPLQTRKMRGRDMPPEDPPLTRGEFSGGIVLAGKQISAASAPAGEKARGCRGGASVFFGGGEDPI